MRKSWVILAATFVAIAAPATAADPVTGNWKYDQPGRGGNSSAVTMYLAAEGSKVTGIIRLPSNGRGGSTGANEVEIKNGKINGDKIAFEVVRVGRDGATVATKFQGTVSGDELKLTIRTEGRMGGDANVGEVVAKSIRCPPEPPGACVK